MNQNTIYQYYSNLAKSYDKTRFENSYGQYIDQQERYFLQSFLDGKNYTKVLDLGCGTGRLMNFASHGTDFSEEMLIRAQEKHPAKEFKLGTITKIPFAIHFECIFCFHVIMHQTKEETGEFLDECSQKLEQNGILIFDFPTKTRRKVISEQGKWHAGNIFSDKDLIELTKNQYRIIGKFGVLLFPIHRFPDKMRSLFLGLDTFLCKTFLKKWASYNIVILEKR